jgi:hypothetical protein
VLPSIFIVIQGRPARFIVPLAIRLTDEALAGRLTCPVRLVPLRVITTALPPLAVVSLTILAPTGIVICSASTVATGGLVTPAAVETCVIPAISKAMGTAMTTTEWDLNLIATLPSVSLVIVRMRAQEGDIGNSR